MPLFLSDEEFNQCSHDASLVAEKADSFIKGLQRQLETVKAQADAASITAEQSCALLEQKYFSLSSDFQNLESQNAQLTSSIEKHLAELAQVQSEKHQLHIKAISKDGEIERLSIEASELHKSKRQLLELVEQKDLEISEKNATIKSYLDKIVNLTDDAALKQAYLHDREAELARSLTACARLSQEKELFERHNTWLNEELTAKVENLTELRRTHAQFEADLSNKLAEVERELSESSSSLKWSRERLKELELELASVQEELCSSKEAAAANEDRFSAEISTVTKLVELYKESSEEWSRKAGDLEGVVKALETHLSQVEIDYKEKLENELSSRKQFEKEATELKEKLEKCEAEIEKNRKADEFSLLQISSFTEETWTCGSGADGGNEHDRMLVPKIPKGVSGTALAASLLRDGWSLAKMYEKYQEAVDALRHERLGRKQSEAILERVLFEIESKAEIILDERAEHERMMEAYSVMNQKLQQSLSEQANLEGAIRELKADLRRRDREYELAQKEIVDLQKQVTILLKECRDIQLRYGSAHIYSDEPNNTSDIEMNDESDTEKVISERLLTFRDINGLVEQNVQLRTLVRSLSDQNAQRDTELREGFEMELQRKSDEAAAKVAVVLERAEEQGQMIESLHSSVAMYKRLYEEELKLHGSYSHSSEAVPDNGRKDLVLLLEGSQDASKKAHEQATQCVKNLEEELVKSRSEVVSLRSERDKLAMEANFARDRLDRFMKECEHQRGEVNGVLARNVELSQLIVDYQRKLREKSDSLIAAEDTSRKLTVEVSLLKHEKELLVNSEKRACDEVRSLSERVHRLQASLDVIQSTNDVREEARSMEKRKREEYLQKVEREWAQAKKELQEERDNVRSLTLDRENKMTNAMTQVEEMGTKLGVALSAVAAAETRAAVAEARYSDLDEKVKNSGEKVFVLDGGHNSLTSADEVAADLQKAKEEIGRLKEEAQANKDHMLQYKSIAQVNEAAMRQIESVHEKFKAEADKSKKSLEADILSLRERISEFENESRSKSHEFASELAQKEVALVSALAEITRLKEESSTKMSQIMGMETQIFSLKEDLEKEHGRWRTAQDNYERQVILQSETIQELTKTSQALAALQEEVSVLRKFADTQKNENDILKAKMETEKFVLEQARNEAEKKCNDINEQNKILHGRLEALHIKLAEKERNSAGTSLQNSCRDVQSDGDMQTVVNYLRRSKEIAETEISLLKQEKLRLQSQLESALKASEIAQSSLHTERGKSKTFVFTDEEFKSLQIQVRETNLLRESNSQLREENKNNLLDCQKLRDEVRKARVETESLATQLREKQFEVDAYLKQIETQNVEKGNSENKIDELLRMYKHIDLETYDRMKNDFQQMEVKLRETGALLEETVRTASEKQNKITSLEKHIASTQSELVEREKQINEVLLAETTLKQDFEKERKHVAHLKKKVENMAKEKEELSKEKQSLSKQLEDSKQGKRIAGDSSNEQILKEKEKEKDTRIQILEKTLEREREELRKEKEENNKEKFRRQKNEQTVVEMLKNITQGKKEVFDEIEKLKRGRDNLPESGGSMVQVGSETDLQNKTAAYVQAVEELTNSVAVDGLGTRTPSLETSSIVDAPSATAAARQVPAQVSAAHPSRTKLVGEKEKRSNIPKPNAEGRKSGRIKLVRPRIGDPEEPTGDTEMPEVEGPSGAEGKLIDNESQGDLTVSVQTTARKRLASSSGSELCEESQAQPETGSIAPVSKKLRGSDSAQESADGLAAITPENLEPPSAPDASLDAGEEPRATDEQMTDAEKDEAHTIGEQGGESKDSPLEGMSQGETQDELNDASEELLDNNTTEMEEIADEKAGDGEDIQQTEAEAEGGSDEEEGELVPDVTEEHDGGDVSIMVTSPELGEVQHEPVPIPDLATSGEGVVVSTGDDVVEATTSEKNDVGEGVEETTAADDSEKSNNNDEEAVEPEKSPKLGSGAAESSSPTKPADPTDDSKVVSTERRTINLASIARRRVEQRQATQAALLSRRGGSSPIRGGTKTRGGGGGRVWRGHGRGRGQGSDEGQDEK